MYNIGVDNVAHRLSYLKQAGNLTKTLYGLIDCGDSSGGAHHWTTIPSLIHWALTYL